MTSWEPYPRPGEVKWCYHGHERKQFEDETFSPKLYLIMSTSPEEVPQTWKTEKRTMGLQAPVYAGAFILSL